MSVALFLRSRGTPAPIISSVLWTDNEDGTATVTWTTDRAAASRVDFGPTTAYGTNVVDAASVTSHSVVVSSGTGVFHFKVTSGETESSDGTGRTTTLVFHDSFTGGADGDDLTGHTADLGGTWVRSPTGSTQKMQLTGTGYARQADANSGFDYYLRSVDSTRIYLEVTVKALVKDNGTFFGQVMSMLPASADGANDWFRSLITDDLARIDDYAASPKGSTTEWSFANSDVIWFRMVYDGKQRLYKSLDGVTFTELAGTLPVKRYDLLPANPGAAGVWNGAARAGIMAYGAGGAATGIWYDDITVREINPAAAHKLVIFDGNSIMRGVGTSDAAHEYYASGAPQLWLDLQSDTNVVMANLGIQSQTTPQMTTWSPAKVAALAKRGYAKVVWIFFEIGNDIVVNAQTGAQAYARALLTLAAVRAAVDPGVDLECGISLVTPRTTAGFNTQKDAANALIVSSAVADGWDFIVTPSDSILLNANNPDGGPAGARFPDGIHPDDTGAATLAANMKTATDLVL